MNYATITIEFLDGSTASVVNVTHTQIRDGVLHLSRRHWMDGLGSWDEDLGSYPLTSIKKWTRKQQ